MHTLTERTITLLTHMPQLDASGDIPSLDKNVSIKDWEECEIFSLLEDFKWRGKIYQDNIKTLNFNL